MLNVLYEKFPDYVTVHGVKYPIETDFREWIRFIELADDDTLPWQMQVQLMMQWYTEEMPEDLEAAILELGDFLAAQKLYSDNNYISEQHSQKQKPAFSFKEDAGCIYSAFVDCYKIDLQTVPYMHWWKFKTLFDWLPEDTEIKQRIHYRTLDANSIKDKEERKRAKRIQNQIALKKKKKYMDDYDIGDVFA
ncbi:MAG: bacteriophage Gp15 family protein [Schaedlerella sp.]|nr:bacteriophage Gp15 family protein [Schaedlerella sp.]